MLQGADESRMDTFDDATLSLLEAASVDEEALKGLSRDDLRDLFPGPENFLKRKKLWNFISENCENTTDQDANSCAMPPCQPQTSTPISSEKKMKMPDPPEYVVYTDSELDMVRSQYFALLCNGKENNYKMSKELCCRLVRNTITSMVAILRASPMVKEVRYPSKLEMRAMSQKIIDYYPMLRDDDPNMPYLTIYTKMYKRLQNMRSPRKRQGSVPQRGVAKTALFSADNQDIETDWTDTSNSSDDTVLLESNDDLSEDNSSAASPAQRPPSVPRKPKTKTLLLPSASSSGSSLGTVIASPTTPAKDDVVGQDSLKMQARHYKTLSNMYNKPNAKPNQSDVAQVLDLEFEARRAFIDADVSREEDRPAKIFEAYPCFRDVRNAMDELRRIVGGTNSRYIEEVKGRWADFCAKVQFYGVWKKALKPPFPLDVRGVEFMLALFNALPSLFPSPTSPPKKLGNSCEALLHVLKSGEDPTLYLEKRPLSSPVLLSDGSTIIVAVGNVPVTTLPQQDFSDGMLVLMAYYYTLHLRYPKCVATLLSVIQTEVIGDTIHDQDATSSYKKAMADWKSFIEK
ncbi:uncharacterized protein LOC121721413 isoform X2 [Alosa sapidissima]|uniref:uncharacterized protein LOC121721413 isoform X2 n=1 Tax=Alosa sapidissima TaxID=34773 RepID=UPI001C0829EB|nr:uncharacterized protein LOC121721413 isoform X2 [Alosa sapidissima]